jgi:hypothetical protein
VSTVGVTVSTVTGVTIVVSVTVGVDSVLVPQEANAMVVITTSAKITFLIFSLFLIVNNK